MCVSLINSLLPQEGSSERIEFDRRTGLALRGKPKKPSGDYQKSLQRAIRLGRIFNLVAKEAAEALLTNRYSSFDAIIKNFGCQITALQVLELVSDIKLKEEALKVQEAAQKQIQLCGQYFGKGFPEGELGMLLNQYLCERAKIDLEVSSKMAQLIRFRLLSIVNTNVPSKKVSDLELPKTNVELLKAKDSKIQPDLYAYSLIVNGLQAEESEIAAAYIYKIAEKVFSKENTENANRLIKGLDQNACRRSVTEQPFSSIISVPLLYNTEAAIRGLVGILLIRNKDKFCGKPILNAKPFSVYVKMPEQVILTDEEVNQLPESAPLYVLEGYVKEEEQLIQSIRQKQLIGLINVQVARLKQYASKTHQDLLPESLQKEIETFQQFDNTESIFKIDHMYCAGITEKRIANNEEGQV